METEDLIERINALIRDVVLLDSQKFPGKSPEALGRVHRYLQWAKDAAQMVPKDTAPE